MGILIGSKMPQAEFGIRRVGDLLQDIEICGYYRPMIRFYVYITCKFEQEK